MQIIASAILLIFVTTLSLAMPSAALSQDVEQVSAEIRVFDELGNPVPFVTVWSTRDPCGIGWKSNLPITGDECLIGAELHRTASRFIETFEYAASDTAPRPFKAIRMSIAADQNGVFRDRIYAPQFSWKVPPGPAQKITVSFAFLKQGYQPALVEAVYTPSNKSFVGSVVIKADPRFPRQDTPNRQAFERIRFELSDPNRNRIMSAANANRLANLKDELERLARDSEAAGERQLAALIHWRLLYLPSINMGEYNEVTRISGYSSGGNDAGNKFWETILRLDPESPFHAVWATVRSLPEGLSDRIRDFRKPLSNEDRKTIEEYIDKREPELQANLDRIWPDRVLIINKLMERTDQFERSYRWIRQYQKIEPRYDGIENYLQFLQRSMKRANVPVPKEWNLPPLPEDRGLPG